MEKKLSRKVSLDCDPVMTEKSCFCSCFFFNKGLYTAVKYTVTQMEQLRSI